MGHTHKQYSAWLLYVIILSESIIKVNALLESLI